MTERLDMPPLAPAPDDLRGGFVEKIGKVYQTIALVSFNTLLMVILLIGLVALILPREMTLVEIADRTVTNTRLIGVNHQISSQFDRAAYRLLDDERITQVFIDADQMPLEGHWQIHPYTGLTLRPFTSQTLNIDIDGHRINPPPDAAYAGQPPLTVWLFGGSTAYGWGMPDDFTVGAQLQTALQAQLPDYQVIVHNFAVPSYNTSLELNLFAAYLREKTPPDIAVFLDGVNELQFLLLTNWQSILPEAQAIVWERYIQSVTELDEQPWVEFNPSFPLVRLARRYNIGAPQPDWQAAPFALRDALYHEPEGHATAAAYDYIANQRMIAALGAVYDVPTLFFLQPIPNFEDETAFVAFHERVISAVDAPQFYDFTDVFDALDADVPLIMDGFTHYSDIATQYLSGQMAEILSLEVVEPFDQG